MSLRHADCNITLSQSLLGIYWPILTRQAAVSLAGVGIDLLACKVAQFDTVCAVDLFSNSIDLGLNGLVEVVEEFEVGFTLADVNDSLGQIPGPSTSLSPVVADNRSVRTSSQGLLAHEGKLSRGVRTNKDVSRAPCLKDARDLRELVDSDNNLDAEFA